MLELIRRGKVGENFGSQRVGDFVAIPSCPEENRNDS